MDLDVRALLDYHCMATKMIREWPSQEDYQREMKVVFGKTGEDNPDGTSLVQFMNAKKGCLCC